MFFHVEHRRQRLVGHIGAQIGYDQQHAGARRTALEAGGPLEFGQGTGIVAVAHAAERERGVQRRRLGTQRAGLVEQGCRRAEVARPQVRFAGQGQQLDIGVVGLQERAEQGQRRFRMVGADVQRHQQLARVKVAGIGVQKFLQVLLGLLMGAQRRLHGAGQQDGGVVLGRSAQQALHRFERGRQFVFAVIEHRFRIHQWQAAAGHLARCRQRRARLGKAASVGLQIGDVDQRLGIVGAPFEDLVLNRQRLVGLAVGAQQVGLEAQAFNVARAGGERALEQGQGGVGLLLPHCNAGQTEQGFGRVSVQLERLVEQRACRFHLAQAQQGAGAQGQRGRALSWRRIRRNIGQDAVVLALHQQRLAQQQGDGAAVGP